MKAAAGAEPREWDRFAAQLTARVSDLTKMRVSIVAPNTMGLEWWPNGWTHVWEQAYDDEDGMRRATADERELLRAGPIEGWADVCYRLGDR
jgi:hypothetical protein